MEDEKKDVFMGPNRNMNLSLNLKKVIKLIVKMGITLLASIYIGVVLLVMAYLLPVSNMQQHLKESISVFAYEGTYPVLVGWSTSDLDNFTDALMLLTAVYEDDTSAFNQMLTACSELSIDKDPVESLLEYYSEDKLSNSVPYSRYWHGYLIFLKPLISIMNYSEIRILNCYLIMVVVGMLFYTIWRLNKKRYVIPTILLIGLLPIISTAWSLQKSSVYYIFLLGSIMLLMKYEKWHDTDKMLLLFMMLGILTSYFDLLTYPLITFGIPICFYFCLSTDINLIQSMKYLVIHGISWCIGYCGMWFGKWIVASIYTENNVILDALEAMRLRTSMTSGWGDKVNLIEMLFLNVKAFIFNPSFIFVIIFCIIMIYRCVKNHSTNFGSAFVFLFIAVLPIIWYIITPNHSMTHWWLFTYRELGITIFAIMCFLTKLADNNQPSLN